MSESEIRMPRTDRLIVSSSPHFHSSNSVFKVMLWVLVALLPSCLAGVYYFGFSAFQVLAVCAVSCVAIEALCSAFMKRALEVHDCSALLTGLLLGMNLPPETPLWICLIGSMIAIGIGKMIYGGIGCNPFNPALIGRCALLISFPQAMNSWVMPGVDAVCSATPLQQLSQAQTAVLEGNSGALSEFLGQVSYWDFFVGRMGGSIGETCTLGLILGGILLIALRIIRWQMPFFLLLTIALFTGTAWLLPPAVYAPPQFHLLTGGVMLGAFFMASDPVTSPLSRTGAILFAIGCGCIISIIRLWGNYPEGVTFAILIMNALTPLIDRATAGKPFGAPKKRGLKL